MKLFLVLASSYFLIPSFLIVEWFLHIFKSLPKYIDITQSIIVRDIWHCSQFSIPNFCRL